ncbi:hypothetical protein SSUD12_0344 [Streptococcus suis D12]|uniref:Uncharacterized protein n=1 Tax=Streptococcus suis D12 TaxID=1004952 RepID=G7SF34_STRSU|nr:hypothetical protein SSUD12_0344 [Streptococcus suis D12]
MEDTQKQSILPLAFTIWYSFNRLKKRQLSLNVIKLSI